MERFTVIETSQDKFGIQPLFQEVTLQNKQGGPHKVSVCNSFPKIPVGTRFKIYNTREAKCVISIKMALSYKVNGRRFVYIEQRPITDFGIAKFWNDLSFFDRLRLHTDIKQALRHQGVRPALNRCTNLRLLLFGKTR